MKKQFSSVIATLKETVTLVIFFVWLITTAVVSLSGPFGTYEALSLSRRFGYWGAILAVAAVIAIIARVVWRPIIKNDPPWLEDVLVAGTLAIGFGPVAVFFNAKVWGVEEPTLTWPLVSLITFLIGIGSVVLRHFIQHKTLMPPKARSRDRLLDRIGAPEGVRLKRVSSDNHHIVIKTTDNQVYRELMRLRDAVADIDVEPGICVHRSHWVALSQITAVETTDGREHVSMPCGCKLPVGPKYRSNLVELGKLSA